MGTALEAGIVPRTCTLCGSAGARDQFVRTGSVRFQEAERIAREHAGRWPGTGYLCRACLSRERVEYVLARLEEQRGELSAVEAVVARRAGEHISIAENLEREFARQATAGQRVADAVAAVGGSWPFVVGFLLVLVVWVSLNVALTARAFDPYPFILLNLVLSCLAALQAPIIMMSQNRMSARDRMEADLDFRTNLKAELEIASLHEKLDHVLHGQFEHMVELQEVQLELLNDLADDRRGLQADAPE